MQAWVVSQYKCMLIVLIGLYMWQDVLVCCWLVLLALPHTLFGTVQWIMHQFVRVSTDRGCRLFLLHTFILCS